MSSAARPAAGGLACASVFVAEVTVCAEVSTLHTCSSKAVSVIVDAGCPRVPWFECTRRLVEVES